MESRDRSANRKLAHLEEIVIRNVQKIVPDRLQAWWVEYRQALKDAKRERVGEVDEEVVGHGVAEAELRNNEGASKFMPSDLPTRASHTLSFFITLISVQVWPRNLRSHTLFTRASSSSAYL